MRQINLKWLRTFATCEHTAAHVGLPFCQKASYALQTCLQQAGAHQQLWNSTNEAS